MISSGTEEIILKIGGIILSIITFRWLYRVFAGNDKKLDKEELKKMTAYLLFIITFIYMVITEGERDDCSTHKFSELWVLIVTIALLYVLSMERVIEAILLFRGRPSDEKNEENKKYEVNG
jgi:NADH:ubiquinone oxidoreductase subunit 5 (subunit L)/multisubunit Na+/H+ antiporter MnhA subunit